MRPRLWVELATAQIRFGPDRDAVRQELLAHIEDLTDHFTQAGFSPQEAQRKAVEAMGDPKDIAGELGRLHSPIYGWLWRLSRWAVILAAVYFVFVAGAALSDWDELSHRHYTPQLPGEVGTSVVITNDYGTEQKKDVLAAWSPKGSANLGGYRVSVPLAWVDRTYYDFDGEPSSALTLTLCIRASTWRIWERAGGSQYMILSHEAVDSTGARYGRWEHDLFSQETHRGYFCHTYDGSPGVTWYEVYLDLPQETDIPDWVEVPIGYGGHVLRVDLAGEVTG